MTTLQHDITANCSPERVWAILSDLEGVAGYNQTVAAARIRGPARAGVGAERECDLKPSGRVVERVIRWEEGSAVGLEVVESDWPITFMRWTTRVEAHVSGSRITQTLEYGVKFGPLGWLLDKLVMRRKLQATLDEVFANLARKAEGAR
ncbi:MAG: SRPBCC family protein [Deltaproteobacteria bacterium]|nr:SRPBCC family protein [Deltaproteobacteria bacterium]